MRMHPGAGLVEDADHLRRPAAGGGRGMWGASVELGRLATAERQVLLAKSQAQDVRTSPG
ncbi:MAG: hypothetical protein ACTH93_04910 [Pseudoclavibacter sp.]